MGTRTLDPSTRALAGASVAELEEAIHDSLDQHNAESKPFAWTKTAKVILNKEARALESCCAC